MLSEKSEQIDQKEAGAKRIKTEADFSCLGDGEKSNVAIKSVTISQQLLRVGNNPAAARCRRNRPQAQGG